jgi:hypothetical protein
LVIASAFINPTRNCKFIFESNGSTHTRCRCRNDCTGIYLDELSWTTSTHT